MLELRLENDASGNPYANAGNIRVTYLAQSAWADGPGLRIQAYRDGETNALHRGAELAQADGYALLAAIAFVLGSVTAQ